MLKEAERGAARSHAEILWKYCSEEDQLVKADFVLALGNKENGVADKAAKLNIENYAPVIICSGCRGRNSPPEQTDTEALRYKKIIVDHGVKEEKIIVEQCSTNTFENFSNTKELTRLLGLNFISGIAVAQPFAVRRARLTAQRQWRESVSKKSRMNWMVVGASKTLFEYLVEDEDSFFRRLTGEIYRIKKYAIKGDIETEHIPQHVYESYEFFRRRDMIEGFRPTPPPSAAPPPA